MALVDYQPERREFNLKGGSFYVEGISLENFTLLIREYMADLETMFTLTQGVLNGKTAPETSDLEQIAMLLANELPQLVGGVIAMASGSFSKESVAAARRLPAPVQIEVLVAIAELTFEEVGGIKKFISSMTTMLAKAKAMNSVLGSPTLLKQP